MESGSENYNMPTWLTVSFVERVLKSFYKNEDIKVTGLSSSDARVRRLSFGSEMHRVRVDFEKENVAQNSTVFIKAHPKGIAGLIAHRNRLFEREISIYKKILPRITRLLESINDTTKISPLCYYASTDFPEVLLVLEDLKCNNYTMFERGRLLNMEHVLPVIQKIAKFHACSAVIASERPDLMRLYIDGAFSNNPHRQDFADLFPANIKTLAKEVQKWKGYEGIAQKLFALEKTILQKSDEMHCTDPNEFRVVNLGDIWINNMMFQYKDKHVLEDVLLFDYPLAYYASPSIDLNYLLFGSLNENVRKVHFKFLVREYHRQLKETLERLNYKGAIPTLRELHIEIIRNSLHAVIAAVCLASLLLIETKNPADLQQLLNNVESAEEFRREMYKNPRYQTFIRWTLKELELSGFLD